MKTKKEELQAELTRLNALRKQVKEKLKALPVLEVGKWYWVHSSKWDDALIFYNGNEDSFGFSHSGEWTDYYNIGCSKTSPANQEDVNRIFIKEAINSGLVNGVKINSLIDGDSAELSGDRYFFNPYPLYFNLGSSHIFANGKWATIIEQDKFAELKEAHKNGAVIQIFDDYKKFWIDVYSPSWVNSFEYRIKPEEPKHFNLTQLTEIAKEQTKAMTAMNERLKKVETSFQVAEKPEEKPMIGDVCKFWDDDENIFIIGELKQIHYSCLDNEFSYPYFTGNYYEYKHAKTLTQQEAIDLLFNKGAN